MSSIIKKWGFYIVMIIVVIFTIALAIFSNHAPKGNSGLEGTLDKIMQYLGIIAIPLVLAYFPQHEKLAKQQQQEVKYHKQAEYLMDGIYKAVDNITRELNEFIKTSEQNDTVILKGFSIPSNDLGKYDRSIFYQLFYIFQSDINSFFNEIYQREIAYKILIQFKILTEIQHDKYEWNFPWFQEQQVWKDNYNAKEVIPFNQVLKSIVEEFSDDTHLKTVIAILKDMDE